MLGRTISVRCDGVWLGSARPGHGFIPDFVSGLYANPAIYRTPPQDSLLVCPTTYNRTLCCFLGSVENPDFFRVPSPCNAAPMLCCMSCVGLAPHPHPRKLLPNVDRSLQSQDQEPMPPIPPPISLCGSLTSAQPSQISHPDAQTICQSSRNDHMTLLIISTKTETVSLAVVITSREQTKM